MAKKGDTYKLRAGITSDEVDDVYISGLTRSSRVLTVSSGGHFTTATSYHRSMRTSPTLSRWLEVVNNDPEMVNVIALPSPGYEPYQWMQDNKPGKGKT